MVRSRAFIALVALAGLAGCGGSLSSPDGSGGGGGAAGGGAAGSGGGIGAIDAGADVDTCLRSPQEPAQPVPGIPCRFVIPVPPCDFLDKSHIGVIVNGVEIPRDTAHVNGWDYTDGAFNDVDIYGPACDALTSGTPLTVDIAYKILI